MDWKETIISALEGKGSLDLALRTAAERDPEEVFMLMQTYKEGTRYVYGAALLNELGIFYYNMQKILPAEKVLHEALKRYQNLAAKNPSYTGDIVKTLTNIGILYSTTGNFSEAEKYYIKALELENSSKDTPEKAIILINLGNLYKDTNQFSEAEDMCRKALKILRKADRETPEVYTPDIALVLGNMGLLYWTTKQFLKAEKVYNEALEIYRHLIRKNPIYTSEFATALNNMGILYQNTQRFSEAEEIHKEALELCQYKSQNPDYVGTADALCNLGNLYWTTKQYLKAEKMYNEALELKKTLSEQNPAFTLDVVLILTNLGNVYRDIQKFEKAEKMYKEALERCRRLTKITPEVYTPYMALVLNNMGNLYRDIKQFDKAETTLEEALQIRRHLAEQNPHAYTSDVAMTLNNLGLLYRNSGRFSKAHNAYSEALEIYWRLQEENTGYTPDIARTLNNVGTLLTDTQRFSKAEETFQKALELYQDLERENPGVYTLDTAGTLRSLGTFYRDTQRFDKAEKMYNEALNLYRNLERENSAYAVHVASVYNDLGIFYQDTRKFYEAENAYKEALDRGINLIQKNPHAYAADLAGTFNNLGNLYNDAYLYGEERFSEAEEVYKRALGIFENLAEESPDVFTPHVAGMLNNVGALYKDTNRLKEAEEAHKKALDLRIKLAEQNPDVYTSEVADSLTSLGIVYERMGNPEAEKYYREAFSKYREQGFWFDAANAFYDLSQVTSNKKTLEKSRKLLEMGIIFTRDRKYTYALKGKYEQLYWSLLENDVSSFSVLETLRDPGLLSLSWDYLLSREELLIAQSDIKSQKKVVNALLDEDIPSITILEKFPKNTLFVYIQELRDYVLFFVIEGNGIHRCTCRKEFLSIGEGLLKNLRIQQGAARKTDNLTFVIEKFQDLVEKWSRILPDEVTRLIKEKDCIVFSPDLRCSHFPLEALQVNGESLCIEKTVVRSTSLHQFLTLFRRSLSFDSSLIIGNPWINYNEEKLIYSLPSGTQQFKISFLKGAEEEAQELSRKLPNSTTFVENKATGNRFISGISQYSLIHFCGHGSLGRILFLSGPYTEFPPQFEPEEFSDLRKAERVKDSGTINMMEEWHPVTDLDLFDVTLREGAVVFLNACETGQHKYAGGGYYQGLPAVFLKNGAHSVVSSLVPVFDEHSREFALHFYDILLETHSVTEALKKARILIKNTRKAQIYWVPYIHYGPPL